MALQVHYFLLAVEGRNNFGSRVCCRNNWTQCAKTEYPNVIGIKKRTLTFYLCIGEGFHEHCSVAHK